VVKRAIRSISKIKRAVILHASINWKDGIDASVWPEAVNYANHIFNNTPKDGVCAADIFRRGVFLGLSQQHASEVPLVLNFGNGRVTNQYHVVFDDLFIVVTSIERETEPPEHWAGLCLENSTRVS
jgi:hypothetical protein